MNILVTGAGGFLGSALVRELKKQGHQVRVLVRKRESANNLNGLEIEIFIGDVLFLEQLEKAVQGIDVIFHTAALFTTYPFYKKYPEELYQTNIEGTRNVCDAALKASVKKIIYTSSTAAVGKTLDGSPADETIELNILNKRSHYEKAKALAEKVALSYHDKGIEVVSVNPSFLFGIQDSRPGPTGELVVKFLNRIYPCYFEAQVYVSDLKTTVDAHISAMHKGKNGQRYIVVYPKSFTVEEIFNILERVSGIKKPKIKLPLSIVYVFSILNEAILGLLGLGKKIRPIISSEIVKYFMLKVKYNGDKATKDFGLAYPPFEAILKDEVDWYMQNGYIKNSSRTIYYKKIGNL